MQAVAYQDTTSRAFAVHTVDRANMSAESVDLTEMLGRLLRAPVARRCEEHLSALAPFMLELHDALTSTTRHPVPLSAAGAMRRYHLAHVGAQSPLSTGPATYSAARKAGGSERAEAAEREAALSEVMSYTPRTALGRRLCALRARIIASGEPLLSREDIERRIAESRGRYDEAEP